MKSPRAAPKCLDGPLPEFATNFTVNDLPPRSLQLKETRASEETLGAT